MSDCSVSCVSCISKRDVCERCIGFRPAPLSSLQLRQRILLPHTESTSVFGTNAASGPVCAKITKYTCARVWKSARADVRAAGADARAPGVRKSVRTVRAWGVRAAYAPHLDELRCFRILSSATVGGYSCVLLQRARLDGSCWLTVRLPAAPHFELTALPLLGATIQKTCHLIINSIALAPA